MKYTKHKINKEGWTDFIKPKMDNYRISCCDCGLTHDFSFKIIDGEVYFKCKRNNRATSQKRKSTIFHPGYEIYNGYRNWEMIEDL